MTEQLHKMTDCELTELCAEHVASENWEALYDAEYILAQRKLGKFVMGLTPQEAIDVIYGGEL